jgi:hypothetical protein
VSRGWFADRFTAAVKRGDLIEGQIDLDEGFNGLWSRGEAEFTLHNPRVTHQAVSCADKICKLLP